MLSTYLRTLGVKEDITMRHQDCPNCGGPLLDVISVEGLSERHQRAIDIFVSKFKAGAREHGDLIKGKSWTKDKIMEQIDYTFYNIFNLLDVLEGEKEKQ